MKTYTLSPTAAKPGIKVYYDAGSALHDVLIGQDSGMRARVPIHRGLYPAFQKGAAGTRWRLMEADVAQVRGIGVELVPPTGSSKGAALVHVISRHNNALASTEIEINGPHEPQIIALGGECKYGGKRIKYQCPEILVVVHPDTTICMRLSTDQREPVPKKHFDQAAFTWDGEEFVPTIFGRLNVSDFVAGPPGAIDPLIESLVDTYLSVCSPRAKDTGTA